MATQQRVVVANRLRVVPVPRPVVGVIARVKELVSVAKAEAAKLQKPCPVQVANGCRGGGKNTRLARMTARGYEPVVERIAEHVFRRRWVATTSAIN